MSKQVKKKIFWGEICSSIGKEERTREIYIAMAQNNHGFYWFEVVRHIRKTLPGIIEAVNKCSVFKGRKVKILRMDLSKADIVFEGKAE